MRDIVDFSRDLFEEVLVSCEVMDRWYTDRVDDAFTTETGRMWLFNSGWSRVALVTRCAKPTPRSGRFSPLKSKKPHEVMRCGGTTSRTVVMRAIR